jgi:Ca-activated chloride channel family protein
VRTGKPAVLTGSFLRLVLSLVFFLGCSSRVVAQQQIAAEAEEGEISLELVYGSEKESWISDVTKSYNNAGHFSGGRRIRVTSTPMGSGEAIDEVLSGRRKFHLLSPASGAFIELANARARQSSGSDLIKRTKNLVLSPVVIAIWKPMAQALGWPEKAIGWSDILALAREPNGWATRGHPEWGTFKFGHTHPEYSNSGLISILAEVYAAAQKHDDLTLEDMAKPEVAAFLHDIESAVVHYGSSTGFFGNTMFASGPQALSAAVLYESLVIESYGDPKLNGPLSYDRETFSVVAIYPREGTFWSDHPIGVVEREWVTAEHRRAAADFINYLLSRPQQQLSMRYGFSPADENIPLTTPFDSRHGVNPEEPKAVLPVPTADVMNGIVDLWRKNKKRSHVAVVLDTSGSMRANQKMYSAQKGAVELVKMLDDQDHLALVLFSDAAVSAAGLARVGENRNVVLSSIRSALPDGQTAMYDAIKQAFDELQRSDTKRVISAIVVLSDGLDNRSSCSIDQLIKTIQVDDERKLTRVFTIYYGTDANRSDMEKISSSTRARAYDGSPENIIKVFKDIATFF